MPTGQLPDDDDATLEPVQTSEVPLSPGHHHPADVECGFCGARVTTTRGEVLRLSTRAKVLRDAEHDVERLTKTIDDLRRELADLKTRLTPTPKDTSGWLV